MKTVNDLDKVLDLMAEREEKLEAFTDAASRIKNAWEAERFRAYESPDLRDKQTFPNETMREAEIAKAPVTLTPCPVCDGVGELLAVLCGACEGGGTFVGTIGDLGALRRTYEHGRDTCTELLRSAKARMTGIQTDLRVIGDAV